MSDIYSFYDLIWQYKIDIPIIQRDYAQGRDTAKAQDVRQALVEKLYNCLVPKSTEQLFLDFVFGKIEDETSETFKTFVPFDGQQRLTTIFLVHKYIFDHTAEPQNYKSLLSRFTYNTRQSAREFCACLTQHNIKPAGKKYSCFVKDQSWFYEEWCYDPTVIGMLTMLDAIHSKFGNNFDFNQAAVKLINKEDCPITFHFVNMGPHKLSDSTYIKMNARGKMLTPFENFKASLEEYFSFKSNGKQDRDGWKALLDRFRGTTSCDQVANNGIDGIWLDYFWNKTKSRINAKDGKEEISPDTVLYAFFRRSMLNEWDIGINTSDAKENVLSSNKKTHTIEEVSTALRQPYINDLHIPFSIYEDMFEGIELETNGHMKIDALCFFDTLFTAFDILCKKEFADIVNDAISPFTTAISPENETIIIPNVSDGGEEFRSRIILYAFMHWVVAHPGKCPTWRRTALQQISRFTWNLAIDPNIRSYEAMIRVMKIVNTTLSEFKKCTNNLSFNNYLANCKIAEGNSSTDKLFNHEIAKAKLILSDGNWEEAIRKAERHLLFKGDIRFLIEDSNENSLEVFKRKSRIASHIIDETKLNDFSANHLWIRATLTFLSKDILKSNAINLANGPFSNWRVLINEQEWLRDEFKKLINYAMEKGAQDIQDIQACMKSLCCSYALNTEYPWLYPLIKPIKNDDCMLTHSSSKLVKKYNNYDADPNLVYLFDGVYRTSSMVLLDACRNQIIDYMLYIIPGMDDDPKANEIECSNKNSCSKYYIGFDIELHQSISGRTLIYLVERKRIRVRFLEEAFSDSSPEASFDEQSLTSLEQVLQALQTAVKEKKSGFDILQRT